MLNRPKLLGLLCLSAGVVMVFAAIGWIRRAGDVRKKLDDPQMVLEQYREAVLRGDRAALERCLLESLRSEATTLLTRAERRSAQCLSWVVIQSDNRGDVAWFEVHEMGRDGWIYPVRYGLRRQRAGWKIVQVVELQPQRAPIPPGTHIREVLAQDSRLPAIHQEKNEPTSSTLDSEPEETLP